MKIMLISRSVSFINPAVSIYDTQRVESRENEKLCCAQHPRISRTALESLRKA